MSAPRFDGQQTLLDLFPEQPTPIRRKAKAPVEDRVHHFLYLRVPMLEQRHLWQLFQRVLRVSSGPCLDKSIVDIVVNVDAEEISRKRNPYLYSPTFWPLDDLHTERADESFCLPSRGVQDELIVSLEDEAFLMELCFLITHLAFDLMKDLQESARQLDAEMILLQQNFPTRNRTYQRFFYDIGSGGVDERLTVRS